MKRLSRYGVIDAYTLEELCRKYRGADTKGRIGILRGFWNGSYSQKPYPPNLPFEVALMAVEDTDVEVRQWVARHAQNLNFEQLETWNKPYEERYDTDGWPKASERELTGKLRNDSDVFVRACLHENSNIVGAVEWSRVFHSATHIERLALMRNAEAASYFNRPVIECLFDPEDKTLTIEAADRKELIVAYISNRAAQRNSHIAEKRHWKGEYEDERKHFSTLWKLAQKWPHPVPMLIFFYFGGEDSTRAEAYQECSERLLQATILESSIGSLHPQTIALGSTSSDTGIGGALEALVGNKTLTLVQLKALERSISDLPDSSGKNLLLEDVESRIAREGTEPQKGWKLYARYSWTLLARLLELAIVLVVLSAAKTTFEAVVFAGLVLIYNGLNSAFRVHALTFAGQMVALNHEFSRLRKLLKQKTSEEEREQQKEIAKQLLGNEVKFWINGIFSFLVWVIALFFLVRAL